MEWVITGIHKDGLQNHKRTPDMFQPFPSGSPNLPLGYGSSALSSNLSLHENFPGENFVPLQYIADVRLIT